MVCVGIELLQLGAQDSVNDNSDFAPKLFMDFAFEVLLPCGVRQRLSPDKFQLSILIARFWTAPRQYERFTPEQYAAHGE